MPRLSLNAHPQDRRFPIDDPAFYGRSVPGFLSSRIGLSHCTTNRLMNALDARLYISQTSSNFELRTRVPPVSTMELTDGSSRLSVRQTSNVAAKQSVLLPLANAHYVLFHQPDEVDETLPSDDWESIT